MPKDKEGLVSRLRKEYTRLPGTGTRLVNPDGPEAATRLAELEAENARLRERSGFWQRNSERWREQAQLNHESYLRLWADHGGPELPPHLRARTVHSKLGE